MGVVILQKHKVLLFQRSGAERHFPNIWELPSGKVENDDATLLDAAARECLEETGMIDQRCFNWSFRMVSKKVAVFVLPSETKVEVSSSLLLKVQD